MRWFQLVNNFTQIIVKIATSNQVNGIILKQKDVHILDVRKSFEYHVGTFKGAKNPNLDNFRDFPKYFKKFNKNSKIAMFCTGGVRCEKASNYLKRKGFNNVFQLKGEYLITLKI